MTQTKQPAIELKKVTKLYGKSVGVKDIDLKVSKGAVFGFLGPNGAGKSTTINMLVDFIRPTSGKVLLFGLDSVLDSVEIRKKVGFLAGDFALDRGLTGWQQLEYFSSFHGSFDRKYVSELANRLDCKLEKKFKTLSRGNKQKVGLIAALMHKPELLIFDEPTSGLDPLIQAEFNRIVLEQKQRGATTFISSHVLSEVQEVCDHIAFIKGGQIVASKPLADIASSAARQVHVVSDDATGRQTVKALAGVSNLSGNKNAIDFTYSGDMTSLLKALAKLKVSDLTIEEPDLETIFMNYYGADDA